MCLGATQSASISVPGEWTPSLYDPNSKSLPPEFSIISGESGNFFSLLPHSLIHSLIILFRPTVTPLLADAVASSSY